MEKNWLIRTKNNHILGPVSKSKVKELVENGSIKADDEICSGNGFWFYVREKELLNKYLLGAEPQPFNPVSEAESVLGDKTQEDLSIDDDIDDEVDDITQVGLSLDDLRKSNEAEKQGPPELKSQTEKKK
ncbi:MAG: hypothetical protein CME64_05020 [Halobacteriovoraceae bacterium]|nr:hypothetical protein [Halobacteriovoraceae bacterium]|tara:strand:+ start:336338 stop:336727 length:390 start_codon:yes stop_codon:yes gene_type:complete